MELKKLENLFYEENNHLVEVLDKDAAGAWVSAKTRGYGIVVIELKGLRFGIPLRSVIKHKECFLTVKGDTKGLDYSKAVLLVKDEYISKNAFKIPTDEFVRIKQKSHKIKVAFTKYVEHYIKGVTNKDEHILAGYKYTTLKNYHKELGLP